MISFQQQIDNAKSIVECQDIQQSLMALLQRVIHKEDMLTLIMQEDEKEERGDDDEFNFQGEDALSCDFCNHTMDPYGAVIGCCEECTAISCIECLTECKGCERLLCKKECIQVYCDECEETVCVHCSTNCMNCGQPSCKDCLRTPVTTTKAKWDCCEDCKDDWV